MKQELGKFLAGAFWRLCALLVVVLPEGLCYSDLKCTVLFWVGAVAGGQPRFGNRGVSGCSPLAARRVCSLSLGRGRFVFA